MFRIIHKIGSNLEVSALGSAAWLLAQKPWIVAILGTTELHRLEENIGAVNVELSPGDLLELESAASKIAVLRARYQKNCKKCWAAEQIAEARQNDMRIGMRGSGRWPRLTSRKRLGVAHLCCLFHGWVRPLFLSLF
jgi:hypothetical protein